MESEQKTNGIGADPQDKEPAGEQERRFFTVPNIIGIILCILMLPGFLISTTLLISSLIHPDVPPSCFGFTPLMVETDSMSPVFDENDVVLINNSDDGDTYGVKEIICYRSGDIYVTHRIKEITQDKDGNTLYITQGDAVNEPDEDLVRPDQILGVYQTRFAGMGKTLMFLQTPLGMILCVVLPFLLVFLLFTVPPYIAARRKRENP